MSQQVVVIHGGDSFQTYEEYLADLRSKEIDNPNFTYEVELGLQDWKSNLAKALGPDFKVIAPRMPNAQNAKYLEWKIWFEKFIPFLHDGAIFVGHSLGGIFLAKYLAEEIFPLKMRATFLIAAPYNTAKENSLGDFVLPTGLLDQLTQQGGEIFLYHSKDDQVVPFADVEKYKTVLPDAAVRVFADRQHFNQATLPRLVEDINSVVNI